MIVDAIQQACRDMGNEHRDFLTEADVVRWGTTFPMSDTKLIIVSEGSLAEAQRMTSVYAKMEYGVKRLLWLGS